MSETLLLCHSLMRWLVLISLLIAIFNAYRGYHTAAVFSKLSNNIRHWTATIAHIQLLIGIIIYTQSPTVKFFWNNPRVAFQHLETTFWGIIHILLMLTAIVVITLGSALSKRRATDSEKFRTILIWFSAALFLIFIAIPWPFSPLANRPYFRW